MISPAEVKQDCETQELFLQAIYSASASQVSYCEATALAQSQLNSEINAKLIQISPISSIHVMALKTRLPTQGRLQPHLLPEHEGQPKPRLLGPNYSSASSAYLLTVSLVD